MGLLWSHNPTRGGGLSYTIKDMRGKGSNIIRHQCAVVLYKMMNQE